MTTEERNDLKHRVGVAADQLAEHFESVLILVTRKTEDGSQNTLSFETGRGNFYAQLGQVTEWLEIQREYQRCEAKRRDEKEDEG